MSETPPRIDPSDSAPKSKVLKSSKSSSRISKTSVTRSKKSSSSSSKPKAESSTVSRKALSSIVLPSVLTDFDQIKTIGTGSFGKVQLVKHRDSGTYFAMKSLHKRKIIALRQTIHIKNERAILLMADHPFIVKLFKCYRDTEKVYMLLDYIPGGELFWHLRRHHRFPLEVAKFYAAELVLALGYLHERNVCYRDLKPENLLLDRDGHLKLTDFGFAKIVPKHTFTLCHGAGTLLLRASGEPVAVEDVREGDALMGDDGTARNVVRTVSGASSRMFKLTTYGDGEERESHVTYVTADHLLPVMVPRPVSEEPRATFFDEHDREGLFVTRELSASDIYDGALSDCRSSARIPVFSSYPEAAASKGVTLQHMFTFHESQHRVTVDTDVAWFIGLFLGDGSTDATSISISDKCHQELMLALKAPSLNALFDSVEHDAPNDRLVLSHSSEIDHSSKLHAFLTSIGFLSTSEECVSLPVKSIPDTVIGWPLALKSALLAGLLDSDSSGAVEQVDTLQSTLLLEKNHVPLVRLKVKAQDDCAIQGFQKVLPMLGRSLGLIPAKHQEAGAQAVVFSGRACLSIVDLLRSASKRAVLYAADGSPLDRRTVYSFQQQPEDKRDLSVLRSAVLSQCGSLFDLSPAADAPFHGVTTDGNRLYVEAVSGAVHHNCGTPEYIAPEVLVGVGHGKAVDFWTVGILFYEMLVGHAPFVHTQRTELYRRVLRGAVSIPHFISDEARSFISQCLQRRPEMRLGSSSFEEVKAHPVFALHNINWDTLPLKQTQPPFRLKISTSSPVANFDSRFTSQPPRMSPSKPGDSVTSEEDKLFREFGWTAPDAFDGPK
eukprot:gnl/Dysnectes_brevis/1965_a2259_1334.p1 GENE.gnl/Dysnectes_brevis/1965_a2259_1334~~gnl/Dysnectes_brevis/1965_a2259_1334.p1  ORF type:complete len:834 (+),score=269.58 gnl/Dysnectes_brevis/1965_a2259_1334:221-2722(+)